MKRVVHVVLGAMLDALWVSVLLVVVAFVTLLVAAFQHVPEAKAIAVCDYEAVAAILCWVLLVIHKATE